MNTEDIIEDIFIAYKLNFSLDELLFDKSILLAYEFSQALNGNIKAGRLSCKINWKNNYGTHYWCTIYSRRIDPVFNFYNKITNMMISDSYYPSIKEISSEVSFQYKHCLECYLDYKEDENE